MPRRASLLADRMPAYFGDGEVDLGEALAGLRNHETPLDMAPPSCFDMGLVICATFM